MLQLIKNLTFLLATFGIVLVGKLLVIFLAFITGLISLSIVMFTVGTYSLFQPTRAFRKLT